MPRNNKKIFIKFISITTRSIIIFFVLFELSYVVFLFLPNKWWYINFYKGFPIYEIVGMIYVSMLITFIFLYGSTLKATLIKFLF